jgi:threo-3-hydroxy-L-aspartate ammonia-lyase
MGGQFCIQYQDIAAASERLRGVAHRTPVLTSATVNHQTQAEVFFKAENFQRSGSFKFRGAFNAMSQLGPEDRSKGVVAYSSGNHAQALALAGKLLGVAVTIVMPSDAPQVKQDATRGYGAKIVFYDRGSQSREDVTQAIVSEGAVLIPPFNHPQVIAGQGTAAKELIEEVGTLDLLLVCCGGGGLLSGSAIAAKHLSPGCQVIGVEPKKADDATRSFNTRSLVKIEVPDTIADGARTQVLGDLTFPIVLDVVDDMVTVSEVAIVRSMLFLWERLKVVVEPTGALGAAAVLEGIVAQPGARIGVILSGGNVDLKQASKLFAQVKPKQDRFALQRRPLTWELS